MVLCFLSPSQQNKPMLVGQKNNCVCYHFISKLWPMLIVIMSGESINKQLQHVSSTEVK
jgi:hypothetical protein